MTAEDIFPYSTLPKVAVDRCPVCDTIPPLRGQNWGRDRYGYRVPISSCPVCHLTYLAEQLTRDGYARLYNGAYRSLTESVTTKILRTPQELQRLIGEGLRPMLAHRIPHGGDVLDAGGSTGGFVHALGIDPDTLTVLDLSATELEAAQRDYATHTIQGWLEDPIPGLYDGVVCFETMDHVTQPVTVLRNFRASCPRGWLLADYVGPGKRAKIDHPLMWHPDAWHRALRASHWTPVFESGYYIGPHNSHFFSLCR